MEKRKADRFELSVAVVYKLNGSKQLRRVISCDDISGLGLKLSLKEQLMLRSKVEITMRFKNNLKPIDALCRVAWISQLEKGKFQAGLEFIRIKDKKRFIEILCEEMLNLTLA
jgi:hypothetical protein